MRQINRSVLTPGPARFLSTGGISANSATKNGPLIRPRRHAIICEMRDTTDSHAESTTPARTPLPNESESHGENIDGDLISIELAGCPDPVPRMLVRREVIAAGRFKIPFRNGYDHFEFDHYTIRNGQETPVFAWTCRTRVAE